MESEKQQKDSDSYMEDQSEESSSLQDQVEEEKEEISYRLVKRRYYCYLCQKEYNKMVSAVENLTCDVCNEGFCEIIDKPQSTQLNQGQSIPSDEADEERRRANEQYRIVFDRNQNTHNRLDINNRSTSNIYGEPRNQERSSRQNEEEEKYVGFQQRQHEIQSHQQDQQPRGQYLHDSGVDRAFLRWNPFRGTAGSNFMGQFFSNSPFFAGFPDQRPRQMSAQDRVFRDPFGPSMLNMDQFFGSFIRPFSFGRIFDDDAFLNYGFEEGFNPNVFATNFSQNFRSFNDMDSILQRVVEMTAHQHQERRRPTKQEAIDRIPVVTISDIHCKKTEGSQELEHPLCTVCQENMALGTKAMIMPCGHIFHPDCVLPWLKEHNTCPVCRFELPTESQ
ncbi:ring finger protein [Stylonychia lemnae]|uniref:Ring finger protein n=1 Tax=Stylonychia lemnae TaxID=5949 RepID=A0A078BBH9_STYLE|nr:ring finger protein [Stylonychia lemnae]|eukprot:CDW91571.1 ring finger protein [Stylonychia lemnae]